MENAGECHRDIYVGLVAEELSKAGYFGQAQTLYGYLLWTKEGKKLCCEASETRCARRYLHHWRQGYSLSPYLSESVRHLTGDEAAGDRVSLEQKLGEKLQRRYGARLAEQRKNNPKVDKVAMAAILTAYWQNLSPAVQDLYGLTFGGMLWQLANKDYLTLDNLASLLDKLPNETPASFETEEPIQEWAGYAWLDEMGAMKYYSNAYLPQTLQKWLAMCEAHTPVSGIITIQRPRQEPLSANYRDWWQKLLTTVFDQAYWQMRQSLREACQASF